MIVFRIRIIFERTWEIVVVQARPKTVKPSTLLN